MSRATPLHGITATMSLSRAAHLVMQARVADVAAWAPYANDPRAVTELHNLRIAAKRLRYSIELLKPGLPPQATTLLAEVEEVQERLGAVHDDDVLLERLRRHSTVVGVRAAQTTARAIVADHGAGLVETALWPDLHGVYSLLARVARERNEHYTAFQTWWSAHGDLLDRLATLTAAPPAVPGAELPA